MREWDKDLEKWAVEVIMCIRITCKEETFIIVWAQEENRIPNRAIKRIEIEEEL